MKSKVIVISPNPYSRYTLTTIYLLRRMNINVSAVICLKMFNINRIMSELGRDGPRLLKKIYRKLVLKSAENTVRGQDSIVSFMTDNEMPFMSVKKFCKANGIEFFTTSDLNVEHVHQFLDIKKPDCIAFTGGGLLRQGIIDRAGKGVINCHMGILPYYRGMDVVQWPILNKDFMNVGMTTHIIDSGVDTGNILEITKVSPDDYSSLKSLRNKFEILMPQALTRACKGLLDGTIKPVPQANQEGLQHFICTDRLAPYVDQLLNENFVKKNKE